MRKNSRRYFNDARLVRHFGDAAPVAKEIIQAENIVDDVTKAAKSGQLDAKEAKNLGQKLKAKMQKVSSYVKSPEGKAMIKKGLVLAGILVAGGLLGAGAFKLIGNAGALKGAMEKTLREMKGLAKVKAQEAVIGKGIDVAMKKGTDVFERIGPKKDAMFVELRIRRYADRLCRRVDVDDPNTQLEKIMAFLRRAFSGAKKGVVQGDVFKKIAASLQKLSNNATDTRSKRLILAIASSVLVMASAAGAVYLLRNKLRDLLLNLYNRLDIHSKKGREMLKDYMVFSKKYQQGAYPELQSKKLDSATSEFLQAYSSYQFPNGVKVDGKAADRVYNSVIDIQHALLAKVKVPQLDMAMYAADRSYEEYIERALGGAGNMDLLVQPEENPFQKSYERRRYITK